MNAINDLQILTLGQIKHLRNSSNPHQSANFKHAEVWFGIAINEGGAVATDTVCRRLQFGSQ